MLKFVVLFLIGLPLIAANDANKLLEKVYKKTRAKSESVELEMQITKSGKNLSRSLSMKRSEEEDKRSLIKILEPSSLKGLGLLSIATDANEQQWVYLPSTKKSRSILAGNKKSSFLDSHLNYEDLSIDMYRNYQSSVDDKDPKYFTIISKSKSKEASYAKIETKIHKKQMLILETKYYDNKGKLVKTLIPSNYKKLEGGIWRAQKISVLLPNSKDKTIMLLKDISLKKIPKSEISKDSLEE